MTGQPIETAPKVTWQDDNDIMLFSPTRGWIRGYWLRDVDYDGEYGSLWVGRYMLFGLLSREPDRPTRWSPLPEAHQEQQAA